jgi:hypothetical protein
MVSDEAVQSEIPARLISNTLCDLTTSGDVAFDTKGTGRRSLLRYQGNWHSQNLPEPLDLRLGDRNDNSPCPEANLHAELQTQANSPASQISTGQFRNKKPPRLSRQGGFFKNENPETNF